MKKSYVNVKFYCHECRDNRGVTCSTFNYILERYSSKCYRCGERMRFIKAITRYEDI
ncbi:hypothetical protein RPYSC3_48230 [Rhodopseudomonas palustris]|nr:hypothetical protein RPYSC3_48230 [Rhodopseudomonas palustris]